MLTQRSTKLERMRALLRSLHNPHTRYPSLLVAGSKGKGSTVAMLAACLEAAGFLTGRYTSPHLINWRERASVNGAPITTPEVLDLAPRVRAAVEDLEPELGQPTTFEVGTAFALLHFAQRSVDIAVVEVGVGGRLDATNVLEPLVSVIAPISYEHTATLGTTLTEIAAHKAGILRRGRPGIVAPQPAEARETIDRIADEVGAQLEHVGDDWRWSLSAASGSVRIDGPEVSLEARVALLGEHQYDNATAAVAALNALARTHPSLAVAPSAMERGLTQVEWPGRLQVLSERPWVVLDGAHNAASAEVVRRAVDASFAFERMTVVLGLTAGKDAEGLLRALLPRAIKLHITRSRHERSADPSELVSIARQLRPDLHVVVERDVDSALDAALREAGADELVLVTGSLFLVGEALVWWHRSRP